MRLRTRISGLTWRMRTGAFGFYAEGALRTIDAIARLTPRGTTLRPRGRTGRMGVLALVVVPSVLLGAEFARDARHGSLLPDGGAMTGEVASLRAALGRYYEGRDGILSGREVAVSVSVSGYTSRPCETDNTPFVTASNTATRPGVIALSRDLLSRYTPGAPFDFGDVVHLGGVGDFVVEDVMAGRWQRHADIWFASLADARRFGRRQVVLTGPYGPVEDYRTAGGRGVTQVASNRGGAAP